MAGKGKERATSNPRSGPVTRAMSSGSTVEDPAPRRPARGRSRGSGRRASPKRTVKCPPQVCSRKGRIYHPPPFNRLCQSTQGIDPQDGRRQRPRVSSSHTLVLTCEPAVPHARSAIWIQGTMLWKPRWRHVTCALHRSGSSTPVLSIFSFFFGFGFLCLGNPTERVSRSAR